MGPGEIRKFGKKTVKMKHFLLHNWLKQISKQIKNKKMIKISKIKKLRY